MGTRLKEMAELLPPKLKQDEDLKLQALTLTARLSLQWWKPLAFDQDFRVFKDLSSIHQHYFSRVPLKGWRPWSREIMRLWEEPSSWGDDDWNKIRARYIEKYQRRFWASALAYSDLSERRDVALKWIVATVLAFGSVGAAVVVALEKIGLT